MSFLTYRNVNLGRGDRIRTCDHLVPNQVRYRTALRPDCLQPYCTGLEERYKDNEYFCSVQIILLDAVFRVEQRVE